MAKKLTNRYVHDPNPELLRALWHIRVEHLDLAKSEDEDWQSFSALFAAKDTGAVVFEDANREPQGFYSMTMIPVAHAGRRAILLNSKYWYVRAGYRGGAGALVSGFKLLPRALFRHGLRRLYFVTTAFPMSYASLTRSIGKSYCLQKEDTPEWERHALTLFARRYPDFDEDLGLVLNQAIPDEPTIVSDEAATLIDEYNTLNPRWREGRSMPLLMPVSPATLLHSAKRTLRRWRRARSKPHHRATA